MLCNKTIPIITTNTTRRYQMKNLLQRTNITGKFTNLYVASWRGLTHGSRPIFEATKGAAQQGLKLNNEI